MLAVALVALMPLAAQQVEVVSDEPLMAVVDSTAQGDAQHRTVWTRGKQVHVIVNGVERVFSPMNSRLDYMWPALSPDGRRVSFFVPGRGIAVIDLRGQLLALPGDYEMPCWYDDEYLVAQDARYDGLQLVSSRIVLLKADGTWLAHLTPADVLATAPSCSNGRIVYKADGCPRAMSIILYPGSGDAGE